MKSQSDAENHKKSRLIAEKVDCRIMSRQMPNIAICRGKRQISRFRTHRDKLLPLGPEGLEDEQSSVGACQCYYMFFTIQPKIAIFMAQFKYLNDGQNAGKFQQSLILTT